MFFREVVCKDNRNNCGAYLKVMDAWEFIVFAENKILKEKWSPYAFLGNTKRQNKFEYIPSTKTMYNWNDDSKLSIINMDLAMKLRHSTKKT